MSKNDTKAKVLEDFLMNCAEDNDLDTLLRAGNNNRVKTENESRKGRRERPIEEARGGGGRRRHRNRSLRAEIAGGRSKLARKRIAKQLIC